MALILSIESATKNCSVALAADGEILALKELHEEKFSHAEKLHSFVLEVMEISGRKLSELDAVAVSKGPGSYTGLRIGVSAAKGLCYALDKPLISIPTLECLARQVEMTEDGIAISLVNLAFSDEPIHPVSNTGKGLLEDFGAEVDEADRTTVAGGDLRDPRAHRARSDNGDYIHINLD